MIFTKKEAEDLAYIIADGLRINKAEEIYEVIKDEGYVKPRKNSDD